MKKTKIITLILICLTSVTFAQTKTTAQKTPLSKEVLIGEWKITKFSPSDPNDKCSPSLLGSLVVLDDKTISYSTCEEGKIVVKKLPYKVVKGILEVYESKVMYGMNSEVTYTNDGSVINPKKLEISFYETGLAILEKTK